MRSGVKCDKILKINIIDEEGNSISLIQNSKSKLII